jgi:SAM-dependent methyltransferase
VAIIDQPVCRACGQRLTQSLVDLGTMALANSYLTAEALGRTEFKAPLHARVCSACRLVQVEAATTPDAIFGHYAYFSSYSASWVEHARGFAVMARKRWTLGAGSLVVEVASNDGYLLRHFVDMAVPVLGIEPAANVAEAAVKAGVPTDVAFFGEETALRLKHAGRTADLLIGNNVFAHVPDINDFVRGLRMLLQPDGVVSLEFPHLLKLIEGVQFDTIYHEHFSYLSLLATQSILEKHGLRIFDVEELPTHGGSLRVMACHQASAAHARLQGVDKVLADERKAGLDSDAGYRDFAPKVNAVRDGLLEFLRTAKRSSKSVVAYGAAAKGNTLLNYCGVGPDLITYVVDLNPHKQGHYLPGSHIPVHAPSQIAATKPDYVLILPWNLKDEIMAQMADVRSWGGRFVIAVPQLTLLA